MRLAAAEHALAPVFLGEALHAIALDTAFPKLHTGCHISNTAKPIAGVAKR